MILSLNEAYAGAKRCAIVATEAKIPTICLYSWKGIAKYVTTYQIHKIKYTNYEYNNYNECNYKSLILLLNEKNKTDRQSYVIFIIFLAYPLI